MRTFIRPRLWKPGVIFVAGTVFAAAWLVRGGHSWFIALIIEVTILISAAAMYIRGGQHTEEGALAASQRDERQQLINLRSRALAGNVAMIASFIGLSVAVAVSGTWWWPCAAIFGVTGFAYLYGLSRFGVGEEGPAEDEEEPEGGEEGPAGDEEGPTGGTAGSGYESRSPINS
jgi:hypothetical protein